MFVEVLFVCLEERANPLSNTAPRTRGGKGGGGGGRGRRREEEGRRREEGGGGREEEREEEMSGWSFLSGAFFSLLSSIGCSVLLSARKLLLFLFLFLDGILWVECRICDIDKTTKAISPHNL